jgi:hypothetical protein
MAKPEPTILTKYGRVTGREWIRRRFYSEFDEWLTTSKLHYIFTRTPAVDGGGREIFHPEFEDLARYQPDAALNQVIGEGNAFFTALPERDRKRVDFAKQQREQSRAAVKAHVTSRRRKHLKPPTIPGL